MSNAYKSKPLSVYCTFNVVNDRDKAKELVVIGNLKLSRKVSITSHIHSKATVLIAKNGKKVTIRKGKIAITVRFKKSS